MIKGERNKCQTYNNYFKYKILDKCLVIRRLVDGSTFRTLNYYNTRNTMTFIICLNKYLTLKYS